MDDTLKELLKTKGFSEAGIAALSGLPEDEQKLLANSLAIVQPKEEEANDLTVNEYLARVPEQFREVFTDGVALLNNRKVALVQSILANECNPFSKEELSQKPVGELEKLAKLAVKPDFSLKGGVTVNQGIASSETPLEEVTLIKEN